MWVVDLVDIITRLLPLYQGIDSAYLFNYFINASLLIVCSYRSIVPESK